MASKEYVIQTEHTSGSTAKHYHGESISTLNNWAANNIPSNAVVTSIQVYYRGKCSLGDTKLYVGFSNSSSDEPSEKLISTEIKTSAGDGWYGNVPFSGRYINTSYSVLSVYMNSGILYKKFTCYSFKVIWNYYIPTYTVTVNAGAGGTVSGGGTFESGTTTTITAIPNTGYKFVKWSHGVTTSGIHLIVNGNGTYTAEFEPIKCNLTVTCEESVSGEKCTVTGGGTYKYGDTVTIQATNIPPNHRLLNWEYTHDRALSVIPAGSDNPLTITLDENLFSDFYYDSDFNAQYICYLEHTGFLLKADASPAEGGVVEYGTFIRGSYSKIRDTIPSNGVIVSYSERDTAAIKANPKTGYKFIKWGDGNTENPRPLSLISDASYTAIFELDKINKIYVGTQQPKAIYVGTQEVKAVYVGTTKVYG